MIRPKALKADARVAVVSPASTPKEPLVRKGMERFASLGYEPVLYPSALTSGPLYYAGDTAARVADLHAAFADPAIDAIICTRGGWGAAELLPHLDAALIKANPKPFLGFSDHTTLHLWFAQVCDLHTFYAPMISPDFARGDVLAEGVDLRSWRHALERTEPWDLNEREGMRVLRAGETVEGTLYGGCLALLVESLGTPYAMAMPEGDIILFVEEVGTKPYQWDRMMLHLRYAGLLDRVKGIVFGDMAQCADDAAEHELLEKALLHNLRDFNGPIAIGLQSGHVNAPNVTLPLGVRARLQCTELASLQILEAAVEFTPAAVK
ncbi:S66 peptidase family protein [Terriglobus roseus]|uniref:Muramoyltetrapeptide carboxypeptidase n=1 Tax=Terriglobus roseus TaxID=392734 RepID=A0A1H4QDZ0_9BACT|nr:LD-carboxypeptidase [Terriglobus roseus]SEC17730.1 muramoyltetrapeptide carboxypeptidase [Terriglobus roseus]